MKYHEIRMKFYEILGLSGPFRCHGVLYLAPSAVLLAAVRC